MKNILISAALLVIVTTTAFAQANTALSNLTSPTSVNQNLIPSSNNGKNLGSSSKGWKDAYFTGAIFLDGFKFIDSPTSNNANTAIGAQVLNSNSTGYGNTGIGFNALLNNTSGSYNNATGSVALYYNTTGGNNNAIGADALFTNVNGYDNVAVGGSALYSNTGFDNTAVGSTAGLHVISGTYNTFLGWGADCGSLGTLTNSTAIGNAASVASSNNFVFGNSSVIGWGFGVAPGSRAIKVGTSSSNGNGAYLTVGGTWTNTSSREKKEDFQKQDRNSILEKINQLEVTKWKYKGTANEYHYGPMADDFHRLFAVGDDSSTSDMDKTGVLFLGMQALTDENEKLKMKNEELESRISAIEKSASITNGYAKVSFTPSNEMMLLGQNIPNPFDNSTLIPFRIPKNCQDASIMITNTSSSEVVRVIPVSCNEDHVSFDARVLASGTYSYSLYVDGALIQTKQMAIVR